MAPPQSTCAENRLAGGRGLDGLLGLYAEQKALYGRVCDLSRRQTALLRAGADIGAIGEILRAKRQCLGEVGAIEGRVRRMRDACAEERRGWSGQARASLQQSVQQVADAIEEILTIEDENDRIILEQARNG